MDCDHYPVPLEPTVARAVAQWGQADREAFEERAAIYEYEAGLPRRRAERQAYLDVCAQQRQRRRDLG